MMEIVVFSMCAIMFVVRYDACSAFLYNHFTIFTTLLTVQVNFCMSLVSTEAKIDEKFILLTKTPFHLSISVSASSQLKSIIMKYL